MIGQVVVWIVIALVIAGLVAPNEALTWWRRGQQGRRGVEWPSLAEAFALPLVAETVTFVLACAETRT